MLADITKFIQRMLAFSRQIAKEIREPYWSPCPRQSSLNNLVFVLSNSLNSITPKSIPPHAVSSASDNLYSDMIHLIYPSKLISVLTLP